MSDQPQFLAEKTGELATLVGYRQIIEALGVSRSTIERAVKDGELLAPRKIRGRAVWLASDINAWGRALFEGRLEVLAKSAVTNPEDLLPEQLESEAVGLVVKAIEKRVGKPIDADGLGIQVTRKITADEYEDAERRVFANYSERFANFDRQRAFVMAAWLFQSLRPFIEKSVSAINKPMHSSTEMLEFFGGNALQDYSWEQLMEKYAEHLRSAE